MNSWKKTASVLIAVLFLTACLPNVIGLSGQNENISGVIESKTIVRYDDPVIIVGNQIPSYQGYAHGNIFVWAHKGGSWEQVVFQIDAADGMWPFDNVHKKYGSDDNPGIFDSDDEIVFMASETGDRVDVGDWAPGADLDKPRLEITAVDPNTGNRGWAYLFYHTTLPAWTSTSYVQWTESTNSLAATNYTMDYPDDDTRNSYFHDLRVTPAGGGTSGQFIDRQKFYSQWRYLFFTGRICEQTWATKWDGTDDDGFTSENSLTEGPVRIIRHWRMCYNPGQSTEWGEKKSFQVFYYRSHVHTLEHGKFWGSTTHQDDRNSVDHVLTSPAAQYWDSNGNSGVIDGTTTGDNFANTSPLSWYQVSSPHGSYVKTADLTITTSPTVTSHWIDDSGANDNDGGRTGASAGKFGDVSMHRMQSFSSSTKWDIDYHLFLLPADSSNQGTDYCARANNPVSTSDVPPLVQEYVPSDTEPPCTVSGTVLIDGVFAYSTTLSTAGTITITATVDDTGLGDSAISGAVWTLGYANFPGTAMEASDGEFNQINENVQATVDLSSWEVGVYEVYVYGTDSKSNQNTTSTEHAVITITDDLPPETLNVLANGEDTISIPFSSASTVTITADIDDTNTGKSIIGGANLTVGPINWPGMNMEPDTPLDSPHETFSFTLDVSEWMPGTYLIHVYGWDDIPNHNTISTAHATVIITDDAAPRIRNVLIDGQPSVVVNLSSLGTATLTGIVDDTGHGDNNVAGANYTLGMANWPGIEMTPDDILDSLVEGFYATIDLAGWAPGTYNFYMYGWDETNDCNISSTAHATIIIVDDIAPMVLDALGNGGKTYEVMLSTAATVTLSATIDDTTKGNSLIGGANFTVGRNNWPGTSMTPDNGLDSPVEGFHHTLDISTWNAGIFHVYFYGWDISPAYNTTSDELVTIVIYDDAAPEIQNVLINGSAEFVVGYTNATTISLTAIIDDTDHGSSFIAGANWTLGLSNWPATPITATDGSFDQVVEEVVDTIDISNWMAGTYLFYVYAWDVIPVYNVSSMAFAKLIIYDNDPPKIHDFQINGEKNASVLLSETEPLLSGWVDDTSTGGSFAAVGAVAIGAENWESMKEMTVVGTVDSPVEQFTLILNHKKMPAGKHDLFMYGADHMNNFNDTSTEQVELTIIDDLPPLTGWSVVVNGMYSITIYETDDKIVQINATV
ncbi:MAG TPA: hypothetical protein ENN76_00515, partial [Euryarchaeota archaeon]|nr:hypothetical protein [Euryarchaeota archaeon]